MKAQIEINDNEIIVNGETFVKKVESKKPKEDKYVITEFGYYSAGYYQFYSKNKGLDKDSSITNKSLTALANGDMVEKERIRTALKLWNDTKYRWSVVDYDFGARLTKLLGDEK